MKIVSVVRVFFLANMLLMLHVSDGSCDTYTPEFYGVYLVDNNSPQELKPYVIRASGGYLGLGGVPFARPGVVAGIGHHPLFVGLRP